MIDKNKDLDLNPELPTSEEVNKALGLADPKPEIVAEDEIILSCYNGIQRATQVFTYPARDKILAARHYSRLLSSAWLTEVHTSFKFTKDQLTNCK